jgi:hypothetical protein
MPQWLRSGREEHRSWKEKDFNRSLLHSVQEI